MTRTDPGSAVSNVETMDELVTRSLGSKQLNVILLSTFALIALLLAMSGIYGVLTFSVAQRTPEIGIRAAPGADRNAILRLVLRQGLQPIAAGMATPAEHQGSP